LVSTSQKEPLIRLGDILASGEGGLGSQSRLEIPLSAFRRHVCILGKSGEGKSVTGMILAEQLSKHCPVMVHDRAGEFAASLGHLPGTIVYEPGRNLTASPFIADQTHVSTADFADDVEKGVSLMEHLPSGLNRDGLLSAPGSRVPGSALRLLLPVLPGRQSLRPYRGAPRHPEALRGMKGWTEGAEAMISRLHPFFSWCPKLPLRSRGLTLCLNCSHF
jgi:hypothetical protein